MEKEKELEKTSVSKPMRNAHGQLLPGNTANPAGRPIGSGNPLKQFQKEEFEKMTDKEKREFLIEVTAFDRWRMAEGQPHQTTDVTSGGKPIPIIAGITQKDNVVLDNDGDKKDQSVAPKNQGGARGDGSVEDSVNSLIAD